MPRGARSEVDPAGLQLHDPMWTSLAVGASGGSMLWWWDSYIHPRGLYQLYRPVHEFLAGIDWGRAHLRQVEPTLEYLVKPKVLPRADLVIEGGPATWSPSPANQPRTVRVNARGLHGGPVSGFLHGLRNHPDLHNPVTFETDFRWPVRFLAEVSDVSGYGGASLAIDLDGRSAIRETFADPDGDRGTETLKKFAGKRVVEIPAGRHRLTVSNGGADWAKVDYRFVAAVERTEPPLVAWASVGDGLAIAWVRREDRTWRRLVEHALPREPAPPSVLSIRGLKPGRWTAQIWDTWTGKISSRRIIKADGNGVARIRLQKIENDVAVRLIPAEL